MPELLAQYTDKTVFHYKGILSPPKHFADWRAFMTAFGTALVKRYGEAEVALSPAGVPQLPSPEPIAGAPGGNIHLRQRAFQSLPDPFSYTALGQPEDE